MHEAVAQPTPEAMADEIRRIGMTVALALDAPELHAPIGMDGFEALKGSLQKFIHRAARECRAYAQGPIIKDSFGNDHGKRRLWRAQLPKPLLSFEYTNKLRINNIASAVMHLDTLAEHLRVYNIHTPQAEKVRTIVRTLPKDLSDGYYQRATSEEKDRIVSAVDAASRAFLRLVTGVE